MMNAVHGKYTDPSNNSLYQPVEYPTISITSIDGIERMQTFDLPWVQEGRRAQRIAKQVLQRAQYKGVFSASFTMKALGCEVGDIVYISFGPLGWSNKPFRILSQGISNTGQVPMTMIEENAAIYAWDAEEEAVVTPTAPTVYDPLNSPYILGISDAEALADGKITSFYQSSAPTAEGIGDIWIDTDDANKLYRWSGSAWVLSRDTGITTAIDAAADAQATADGKVVTFYSTTTPTAEAIGDLWYNSSNNLLKRWNGSAWLDVSNNYTNTAQLTDGAGLGTTAVWSGVSGSGRPEDNATVGAPSGTSVAGRSADTVANTIKSDGVLNTNKVITDSITNNAVNVPVYAYTSSGIIIASYQTIQSVSITTSGSVVKLDFSFLLAGNTLGCNFKLTRNGTDVIPVSSLGGGSGGLVAFTIGDAPAAGTYTYELLAQASGTVPLALLRSLFATEIKK
jgi:hypothetical protein